MSTKQNDVPPCKNVVSLSLRKDSDSKCGKCREEVGPKTYLRTLRPGASTSRHEFFLGEDLIVFISLLLIPSTMPGTQLNAMFPE